MRRPTIIQWDPVRGEYVDSSLTFGFPLGGIGTGGISINSDGSFGHLRCNNNWMNAIPEARGTFFAAYVRTADQTVARILRRAAPREFTNVTPIRSTRFKGELPGFELVYQDDLPVGIRLNGLTPHIPQNIKDSTLPIALFRFTIENPGPQPATISILCAWENILGKGGTGYTGLKQLGTFPIGFKPRYTYTDVTGNYQHRCEIDGRPALVFATHQKAEEHSHRRGALGEYCLIAEPPHGFAVSICDGFNAREDAPAVLDDFIRSGSITSPSQRIIGSHSVQPAAAIAVKGDLAAQTTAEIVFTLVWWTPDHVTSRVPSNPNLGVRVGHIYENYFAGSRECAAYCLTERERLVRESTVLPRILDQSNLPVWLTRAIKNSIVATLTNTVVTRAGDLYTLEGVGWNWPIGGLTGTNDQRLSSHPYTSVFFTELDQREVDTFRRLTDARGSVPHGNGNCDLSLNDTTIPYGTIMPITYIVQARRWTDLTPSEIIQAGKLYRITGDRDWIERFWPDLKRMADYLDRICVHGVPEGGTTYDVWHFPGTFIYTATTYLAALKTMIDLAEEREPSLVSLYQKRYEACTDRIQKALWDEKNGYFKSSPERPTVFTGALAGDWAARYAGLGGVIDPTQARRHMAHAYRLLIEGAYRARKENPPKPLSEARLDGQPVRYLRGLISYSDWYVVLPLQVVSYQACEHIYLGQVSEGLACLEMIYDRMYMRGMPWGYHVDGSEGAIYMTSPVAWSILNALTGAALDAPRGVLHLGPRALPGQGGLKCPFFFPPFWAMLEYDAATGKTAIEVLRHFGTPVTITAIVHTTADGTAARQALPHPIALQAGARLDLVLA